MTALKRTAVPRPPNVWLIFVEEERKVLGFMFDEIVKQKFGCDFFWQGFFKVWNIISFFEKKFAFQAILTALHFCGAFL